MQRVSDFSYFLRRGRARPVEEQTEHKFNPWHDPDDGRFTFVGQGRYYGRGPSVDPSRVTTPQRFAQRGPNPRIRMRGNGGPPLHDPKTLEQAFPGLKSASAGTIIGVADNILDLTGPAQRLTTEIARAHANALEREIQSLDPKFRIDSLEAGGFPSTNEGQTNLISSLRLERAKAYYHKGELRPLQVETLRFLQERVDVAYELGLKELAAKRLPVRLSEAEALGNFIDGIVRAELKAFLGELGISIQKGQLVQVNRRANHVPESGYSRPDSSIGNIAFDVTLSAKNLKTTQVQNFFRTNLRPRAVVIVRPSRLGKNSSYIITRPAGH